MIRDLVVDTDGCDGPFSQTEASGSPGGVTDLGLEDVDISGEGSVGALLGGRYQLRRDWRGQRGYWWWLF